MGREHFERLKKMGKMYQANHPEAKKKEEQRLKQQMNNWREIMRARKITVKSIPYAKPLAFVLKNIGKSRTVIRTTDDKRFGKTLPKYSNIYKERTLKIWTLIFHPKKREGRTAEIHISEVIWERLILLSNLLKEKEFEQGNIILYYRKDQKSIWLAFATEQQFIEYVGDIFKRNVVEEYEKKIPWQKSDGRYDELLFKKYYGGELFDK